MYLAWQEIKKNKKRFSMIGGIVVLIAWLVFILSGLGNGLGALSASAIQTLNGDYLIFEKESDNTFSKSIISGDDSSQVSGMKGVKQATVLGSYRQSIQNVSRENEKKIDVTVEGISPNSFIEPKVIEGQKLDKAKPTEVLADSLLKREGVELGDVIKLSGVDTEYTIRGFVKNHTANHFATIIMAMAEWQKSRFLAPGSDEGINNPVNAIVIQTDGTFLNKDVEKLFSNYQVATRQEAVNGMPGYKQEVGTITLMLVFLIIISAIIIGVFFYVMTLQKTLQFGIMKSIGATNLFISTMIVSQVSIISLISIGVGLILTFLVSLILPPAMPFLLDGRLVLLYSLAIFTISLISSLFSVRETVKIDPLIALGRIE